jgi:hypothetical protein
MRVVDRLNGSTNTSSPPDSGGKRQVKKQAKREAKLMLQVEQARKDAQKAEKKASKAQAQLEDSRKQLHELEEKLAALRSPQQQTNDQGSAHVPRGNNQDNTNPNSGMTEQQVQQGQQGQQEQLPSDETYVGGAVDTERATTPYLALGDVVQSEEQEQFQTDAVARDMEQAEDQGVVSEPPDTQNQASNLGQSELQGQHSDTYFESRSDEEDQDTEPTTSEPEPHNPDQQ